MFMQIPPFQQFVPDRLIDRNAAGRIKIQGAEQIPDCDQCEVMLGLTEPNLCRIQFTALKRKPNRSSDEWLPSVELASRRHRPQQSLAVNH